MFIIYFFILYLHKLNMSTILYKNVNHIPKYFKYKRNYCDSSPLSGIKIIDLTRIVAGPFCTMILGDLGAEIIKVEDPRTGDEARKWGPPFKGGESCYFLCLNRNKKSLAIDLKSKEGIQIIYDLTTKCDVLVENFVPGKLQKLGLGYEKLSQINPRLIYCSISGYGSVGPYSNRPGYDVIAASIGGLLNITGTKTEPVKVGVAVTDLSTGLYAHGAIMAALLKRFKTDKGQKIDCNLLSTQVASLINIGSNYLIANKSANRWGTAHESIVPYEAFPTQNGYYTIGTGSDKQFQDLCHKLGLESLAKNKKFLTNQDRVKNRDELIKILKDLLKKKTNQHLNELFKDASFPNGPINNLEETFNDPHIKDIKIVKEILHPVSGCIKVVGPPVVYSEGGNDIRLPPPVLGQHSKDILKNLLDYGDQKINDLIQNKVITYNEVP